MAQNEPVLIKYPIKIIGKSHGLPSGQVHQVACDTQDFLWFAGPSGLTQFDGSRVFTYDQNHGLSTQGLRSLCPMPDLSLWIGTDVGVDIREPDGTFHPLVDSLAWSFGYVDQIIQYSEKYLLFSTSLGLIPWCIDTNSVENEVLKPLNQIISSILIDSKGHIWVSGPNFGLLKFDGRSWVEPIFDDWNSLGQINCIVNGSQSEGQTIFIGGFNGWAEIDLSGSILNRQDGGSVKAILNIHDEMWLSVNDDLILYQWSNNQWEYSQVVAENCQLKHFQTDRFGNVWAASNARGVMKISALRKSIFHVDLPNTTSVFSIRKINDQQFLVGGNQHGFMIEMDKFIQVQQINEEGIGSIWDMLNDEEGNIWLASERGLFKSLNGNIEKVGDNHETLTGACRTLLKRDNTIFVGSRKGLVEINSDEILRVLLPSGASFGYVYSLIQDNDGYLWVGTIGNGLWRETENGFERFVSEHVYPLGNVYAVKQNREGQMVVLQDNRIVLLEKDGTSTLVAKTNSAVAGWSMECLNNENLFIGSSNGLLEYKIDKKMMVRNISPKVNLDDWEFTTSRSLCLNQKKQLLCGLNTGLLIVDLNVLDEIEEKPVVTLGQVQWSINDYELIDNEYVLSSGKWTVEAELNARWYYDEDNIKYRYRLIGFDEHWSDWNNRHFVKYSSLPGGYYVLEAQASSELNGVGPIEKLMKIRVSHPAWFKPWMSSLYSYFDYFVTLFNKQAKNRRLLEINRKLEHDVAERTIELSRSNAALQNVNAELAKLSLIDPLTGVANRRHLNQLLHSEVLRARRMNSSLSIAILDIDYFKFYNDTYGHVKGDECLHQVATELNQNLRGAGDFLARYGGEEFVILFPNTSAAHAEIVAERLCRGIESLAIPHAGSKISDVLTISIGMYTNDFNFHDIQDQDELIKKADDALYQAKEAGRNQWVVSVKT